MPRAVSVVNEERHNLKSLAGEGEDQGFIVARRLTYGEKIQRRAMVSNMKIQAQRGKKDFEGEMQLVTEQSTVFDFQKCILDHNLEDEDGRKLDFSKIADIRKLDPRIGEEIDQILNDMNNFEDDEEN